MNLSERAEDTLKKELAASLENRGTALVVLETILALVILLPAFLGNTLLCFAIFRTRALLQNPQNFFMVSLAVTDILYAVLCMLPGVGVLITGRWPFGNIMCQIQGSFALILGAVSLLTMALIAVNRYYKIVRSTDVYQKIFTKRNILLLIAAPWMYAIVSVFSLFFVVSNVYEVRLEKLICYASLEQSETVRLMILGGYLLVVIVSFPSIVVSYYKVYKKIHSHFTAVTNSALHDNNARAFVNEVRITKMLFVTFVCLVICWTPALAIDQTEAVRGQYIFPRKLYLLGTFSVQISSAINPLIYGLLRREFREAYKKMLRCGYD